jgi:hypothetical protein
MLQPAAGGNGGNSSAASTAPLLSVTTAPQNPAGGNTSSSQPPPQPPILDARRKQAAHLVMSFVPWRPLLPPQPSIARKLRPSIEAWGAPGPAPIAGPGPGPSPRAPKSTCIGNSYSNAMPSVGATSSSSCKGGNQIPQRAMVAGVQQPSANVGAELSRLPESGGEGSAAAASEPGRTSPPQSVAHCNGNHYTTATSQPTDAACDILQAGQSGGQLGAATTFRGAGSTAAATQHVPTKGLRGWKLTSAPPASHVLAGLPPSPQLLLVQPPQPGVAEGPGACKLLRMGLGGSVALTATAGVVHLASSKEDGEECSAPVPEHNLGLLAPTVRCTEHELRRSGGRSSLGYSGDSSAAMAGAWSGAGLGAATPRAPTSYCPAATAPSSTLGQEGSCAFDPYPRNSASGAGCASDSRAFTMMERVLRRLSANDACSSTGQRTAAPTPTCQGTPSAAPLTPNALGWSPQRPGPVPPLSARGGSGGVCEAGGSAPFMRSIDGLAAAAVTAQHGGGGSRVIQQVGGWVDGWANGYQCRCRQPLPATEGLAVASTQLSTQHN